MQTHFVPSAWPIARENRVQCDAVKALFFNCACGISGDMHLAALIDLGVPVDYVKSELAKLALDDEFALDIRPDQKMGISGTRLEVCLRDAQPEAHHHHAEGHRHGHVPHRRYRDIRKLIDASPYSPQTKQTAHAIFRLIGAAEAKIHGTDLDDVHFHEVGATDSIVDIVGAAIALNYLGVDRVLCGPVEVGGGQVACEHGVFPVPAPATAELLTGVPCRFGAVDGETTTPTGAAILKCVVDAFEPRGCFTPESIGYGIGHKDFAIPNVLRAMLGDYSETSPKTALPEAPDYKITTNIDDMSAEAFEPLMDSLFASGASDVFLTPIVMKKSRLAQMVTVLCKAEDREVLTERLVQNSSTIGVRIQPVYKVMLARSVETVATSLGPIDAKVATLPDGGTRWKVEHDHVVAVARDAGLAYAEARRRIETEVAEALIGARGCGHEK